MCVVSETMTRREAEQWLETTPPAQTHEVEFVERFMAGNTEDMDLHEKAQGDVIRREVQRMLALRTVEYHDYARYRAALQHIASGNISPAIGFAQRVLDGSEVLEAHRAEAAQ